MKQIHFHTIIVLFAVLKLNASDKGTHSLISEYSEQESGISAPADFYLWCLEDHIILPQNFANYSVRLNKLFNLPHLFNLCY